MLRLLAFLFGFIFLALGGFAFNQQLYQKDLFLGLFHLNYEHNLVHIATGVIAVVCGFISKYASRLFFQIFGIIYIIIAGLGFYFGDASIFGTISNSFADSWLNTAIAVISLYLGFFYKD